MRIERITEIEPILDCIPFEQAIRNKGRDITRISKMILFLKDVVANPFYGCWIAYDDDKIVGYAMAAACNTPVLKCVHVYRVVAPRKDIKEELKKVLIEFGKEHKIKPGIFRIEAFTNQKALKKNGWMEISTVMEKRYYA